MFNEVFKMLKKEAKELVIKWAEIIAKGAGQGVMTHPNSDERRQILEAVRVMTKNLTKHNSQKNQSAKDKPCKHCGSPKIAHQDSCVNYEAD